MLKRPGSKNLDSIEVILRTSGLDENVVQKEPHPPDNPLSRCVALYHIDIIRFFRLSCFSFRFVRHFYLLLF
jgi:hypothetical protein